MTHSLTWYWEAGGMGMYPLTLLLMLGVALAVVALIFVATHRQSRAVRPLTVALGALALVTVLVGAAARASTLAQVEAVLPNVNPADRDTILDAAHEEAQIPFVYSQLIAAPLLIATLALVALRRKPNPPPPSP